MGLFDWAKKRRANKEIQDTLNDTFGDLTDKEIAQAYKNAGASRKDVEDILTIKHGMTEEFTQDMLDSQTRIVINMLKQYSDMSELQSALKAVLLVNAVCWMGFQQKNSKR